MRHYIGRLAKRIQPRYRNWRAAGQIGWDAFFAKDASKKNYARYQIIQALAHRFGGYRVYLYSLGWHRDPKMTELWCKFKHIESKEQSYRQLRDRHYILYSMAGATASLPGDTAECGVFKGDGSYFICAARKEQGNHVHHAFDSFEGLSEPDPADLPDDPAARTYQKGTFARSLAAVQKSLDEFDSIKYHPGWIPERFKDVADRKFSFVHIDVDLYKPTLDSLEFFYERVVPGGIILCDDYGFTDCPGARKAFDEFVTVTPQAEPICLTTGQAFIVKR